MKRELDIVAGRSGISGCQRAVRNLQLTQIPQFLFQQRQEATNYLLCGRLAGGMIPFMRKYSTICP